jgi:uncharacterized protein (DUF427 family)
MTEKKVLVPGPDHPITIVPTDARVTVRAGGRVIADTAKALTLQEAAFPPVQYIPLADVEPDVLEPSDHTSYCPFKGDASYYGLRVGDQVSPAAVWTYAEPHDAAARIAGHVAFYPDRVDAIEVHDGA